MFRDHLHKAIKSGNLKFGTQKLTARKVPRLRKITVMNLFGRFNYQIPLHDHERLTILTAPNGYGKSTILRVVYNLLNGNLQKVTEVPFSTIKLDFDDSRFVEFVRIVDGVANTIKIQINEGTVSQVTGSAVYGTPLFKGPDATLAHAKVIADSYPNLKHVAYDSFYNTETGESTTCKEVAEQYLADIGSDNSQPGPTDLFFELRESRLLFITANRIHGASQDSNQGGSSDSSSTVNDISTLVLDQVHSSLSNYAQYSEVVDKRFTSQVLASINKDGNSITEISQQDLVNLNNIQSNVTQFQRKLVDLGIFERTEESVPEDLEINNGVAIKVLQIHYSNIAKKLLHLEKISLALELLIEFLNESFSFKKVTFSLADGLLITTDLNERLQLDALSSGEQHLLVLYGRLLFGESPTLVLLDEPEISLHLAWQLQFLNHLERIAHFRPFDVLVSTHSPLLIDGRDDLMVELSDMVP
jgi:predicted ATP-binding protein involved in virulence